MDCCEIAVGTGHSQSVAPAVCNVCGKKARRVERITVEHILKDERRDEIAETRYYFCETPDCDVVYFSNKARQCFTKADARVRVGIKEAHDPIPICYCFDHTAASARDEIARTGRSTVAASINAEILAGNCACEIKNPSGRCCLGEVSKTIKALLHEREAAITGARSLDSDLANSKIALSSDGADDGSKKSSGSPEQSRAKH